MAELEKRGQEDELHGYLGRLQQKEQAKLKFTLILQAELISKTANTRFLQQRLSLKAQQCTYAYAIFLGLNAKM